MGTHSQPRERKRLRRLFGLPIFGWVALATVGVAIAAYVLISGVTGQIDIASMGVTLDSIDTDIETGVDTCSGVPTGNGEFEFVWTDAMPGDICKLVLHYRSDSAMPPTLQSFKWAAGTAAMPDVVADFGLGNGSCGLVPTDTSGDVWLVVELADDPTFANGNQTLSFAAGDGAEWVSAGYDVGLCNDWLP